MFSRLDHLNRELAIDADRQRLQRQPARLNRVGHDPPVQTPARHGRDQVDIDLKHIERLKVQGADDSLDRFRVRLQATLHAGADVVKPQRLAIGQGGKVVHAVISAQAGALDTVSNDCAVRF
ncbi:hypothetical protein D3C72_1799360 [compost metagenome]